MTHCLRLSVLRLWLLAFLSVFVFWGAVDAAAKPTLKLGIDVLESEGFLPIRGKQVGLLTHEAAVNTKGVPTKTLIQEAKDVGLVALFVPEHGLQGKQAAQEKVVGSAQGGVPIYSLYGDTLRPTPDMLKGIDLFLVDLQDVGVRSYTYLTTIKYCMEACFEQGIEVMILDRPNPLGGYKVSGPVADIKDLSFYTPYPIPYVYGLTYAELAIMAKEEWGWLNLSAKDQKSGKLRVVPMQGWTRSMFWSDTGLDWKATSPSIKDLSAVLGYALTGLGAQVGGFRHGMGTPYPFRFLTFPGVSIQDLKRALESKHIPGIELQGIRAFNEKTHAYEDGLYVWVTDWSSVRLTEISFYMMQLSCQLTHKNPFRHMTEQEMRTWNELVEAPAWWQEIYAMGEYADVASFVEYFDEESRIFREKSKRYYLYN